MIVARVPEDEGEEEDDFHRREQKGGGQDVTIGERELQRNGDHHGKQDRPTWLRTSLELPWPRTLGDSVTA